MNPKQVVEHFRTRSDDLRRKWIDTMLAQGLLKKMSPEDIEKESRTIYDLCVACLETGKYTGAEEYATTRASAGVIRGLTATDFLSGMLALRDIYSKSLIERFRKEGTFEDALSIYEPVANQILLRCILAFAREKEILARTPLEASADILNEWIWALQKLSQTPEGMRTFRRIEYDARKDWFDRTFGTALKKTKTAYDACVQYREEGHERGAVRKEQLLLEAKGQSVAATFVQPCPYVRACIWTKEGGMDLICLRAAPLLMAVELTSGKLYQSQLLTFDSQKACTVSVLPAEREFQVLLSKLSEGSLRINEVDAKRLRLDLVDNVTVSPVREEHAGRGLRAMSFSTSAVPRGLIVMNAADARKLELQENEAVRIRRSGAE